MHLAAGFMARAIHIVLLVLDPEVILLGGGLTDEQECMVEPIRSALREPAYFPQHAAANLQRAELWDDAVLYGAVSLAESAG